MGTEYEKVRSRVITGQGDALREWRESRRRPYIPPVISEGQDMVRGFTGEIQPVPRYTPPGAERVVFRRLKQKRKRRTHWCSRCNRYVRACEHDERPRGAA